MSLRTQNEKGDDSASERSLSPRRALVAFAALLAIVIASSGAVGQGLPIAPEPGEIMGPNAAQDYADRMAALGLASSGVPNLAVFSAESYNPASGTFSTLLSSMMVTPRFGHTATVLADGTLLIAGGYDARMHALARAEIYDNATQTFRQTGSMATTRVYHVATLLPGGKVLIAGGADGQGNALKSAELYDPSTGTFTATGSMHQTRILPVAVFSQLGDGVLIAGGSSTAPPAVLSSVEFYYPPNGTFFQLTDTLASPLQAESATVLALPNQVLLAGGNTTTANTPTANAELFSTSSGMSTLTEPMMTARAFHTGTLLDNGFALIAGGFNSGAGALSSAEIFDPAFGGFFEPTGRMAIARYKHSATAVSINNATDVLVAGGLGISGAALASAELYDLGVNGFRTTGSMMTARAVHQASALGGPVLMTGATIQRRHCRRHGSPTWPISGRSRHSPLIRPAGSEARGTC
jgi:hypothetical protein